MLSSEQKTVGYISFIQMVLISMQTLIGRHDFTEKGMNYGYTTHWNDNHPNVLDICNEDGAAKYTKLRIADVIDNNLLHFSSCLL